MAQFPSIFDLHDVRMPKQAEQPGLISRTLHHLVVRRPACVEKLEGDHTPEVTRRVLLCEIHPTKATFSDDT